MADASVGGKVAVNHPRGKNLLGTFHPPVLVIADVDYLATLPARDRAAGLAEIYKAGRVGAPDLLDLLRAGPPEAPGAWASVFALAVGVKARIVEEDERDEGARRALNYGHTVGHALERLLGPDAIRHGEAVALGMGVAARVARALDRRACERQAEDLDRLGLPTELPGRIDVDGLLDAMSLDKKRRPGEGHTFVLPTGDVGVTVVEDLTEREIRRAL
jgi:3-dehydroquinate synthase